MSVIWTLTGRKNCLNADYLYINIFVQIKNMFALKNAPVFFNSPYFFMNSAGDLRVRISQVYWLNQDTQDLPHPIPVWYHDSSKICAWSKKDHNIISAYAEPTQDVTGWT